MNRTGTARMLCTKDMYYWQAGSGRFCLKSIHFVVKDMCCFGMHQEVDGKHMFVKKPTGFMTNAFEIARELRELERLCWEARLRYRKILKRRLQQSWWDWFWEMVGY